MTLLISYVILVNLLGFVVMGIDKRKAKHHQWRISEKTLWGIMIIGGSVGSFLGMQFFHHKTKHRSFQLGVPLLIFLQIGLLISLLMS
ncbi:DUF1294 domain-containing protein [Lentibacillus sp. N15]|uniref:DUF1294 domain-containing protein n=1 Tax=Lentibacillus songyuanensis TaxID=3136161 RepID=UPI0031BA4BFA